MATLVAPAPGEAYYLDGCRQPFVDVNGTRWIKFYYQDMTGYTTLSTLSVGRWNSAMGPPQQMTLVTNGQNTVFLSEAYFDDTTFDGITFQQCNTQTGYYTLLTSSYVNQALADAYSSGARFSVMVHEIGHALGLAHNPAHGSCAAVQVMYFSTDRYANCGIQAPKSDDIAGVNAIY